jgi:hypothetical protein
VRWIDQCEPFHCSERVTPTPPRPVAYPTAVHAVRDGQEAALSTAVRAPAGTAVGSIDQCELEAGVAPASDTDRATHPATARGGARLLIAPAQARSDRQPWAPDPISVG